MVVGPIVSRIANLVTPLGGGQIRHFSTENLAIKRQIPFTSQMDSLGEDIHGERFRVDGNQELGFTFIERRRYRKLVLKVKQMKLRRMMTVLGPIGFSFILD